MTVTVVAKKDKAEAEGTAKLIVIDRPPVIKSVPQNLVHRLHDTIDLSKVEIEIESKSAPTLVWKSVKTPSAEVELDAETYEFQEIGTHEFVFKVINLGGTASGKLIVTVTESDLTVSLKDDEGNAVEVVDNSALLFPGTYVVTITADGGFGIVITFLYYA